MEQITTQGLLGLLPMIILTGGVLLLMIVSAVQRNHWVASRLSLLSLAGAFLSIFSITSSTPIDVGPLFVVDNFFLLYTGIILLVSMIVVLLSYSYFREHNINHVEYYLLILISTIGGITLAGSRHFVSFFLGLEVLSVGLYALISYLRERVKCVEGGLKYLILAAVSSAFLLFGMALVYVELGAMSFGGIAEAIQQTSLSVTLLAGFALMSVGVGFKLAVVPFHLWTPDVYEGAPAPVTAFIATVSKGGIFALWLRFFVTIDGYQYPSILMIFSVIAIASMFIGNLLALLQHNVKRILAYSSIAHLGYLLVAFLAGGRVGVEAATFYLVAYFITILGAFGIVSLMSSRQREAEDLEDYRALFWRNPWLALIFTAVLLSLAGIPLTAGFIGKYYILAAGVNSSLWGLVIALAASSVVGLFYYLRIIATMFYPLAQAQEEEMSKDFSEIRPSFTLENNVVLSVVFVLLLGVGVYPTYFIHIVQQMVKVLY